MGLYGTIILQICLGTRSVRGPSLLSVPRPQVGLQERKRRKPKRRNNKINDTSGHTEIKFNILRVMRGRSSPVLDIYWRVALRVPTCS